MFKVSKFIFSARVARPVDTGRETGSNQQYLRIFIYFNNGLICDFVMKENWVLLRCMSVGLRWRKNFLFSLE